MLETQNQEWFNCARPSAPLRLILRNIFSGSFGRKFSWTTNDGKYDQEECAAKQFVISVECRRASSLMTVWKRTLSVIYCTAFLKLCKSNSYWVFQTTVRDGRFVAWLWEVTIFHCSPSYSLLLKVPLPSVHQPPSLASLYQSDLMPHYKHDGVFCFWEVLAFSKDWIATKAISYLFEWRRRKGGSRDMKLDFLWPMPGLIFFSVCTLLTLYLFLLPSRLPQGSWCFSGASVGGGCDLVPWLGRSAYLEAAGHHPRQTGVRQIWGGTSPCQVGHGQWMF